MAFNFSNTLREYGHNGNRIILFDVGLFISTLLMVVSCSVLQKHFIFVSGYACPNLVHSIVVS